MNIWEAVQECPPKALKEIKGGKLRGMSDINPIWRLKMLTELFGPAGDGWKTEDEEYTLLDGAGGEKVVICLLKLRYVMPDIGDWSEPVSGQGGSKLISLEKGELVTNDEAYKMAYTDAVSVACKALGFAANVYWASGADSKYSKQTDDDPLGTGGRDIKLPARGYVCEACGGTLTPGQKSLSEQKYGRLLCPKCQPKEENNA